MCLSNWLHYAAFYNVNSSTIGGISALSSFLPLSQGTPALRSLLVYYIEPHLHERHHHARQAIVNMLRFMTLILRSTYAHTYCVVIHPSETFCCAGLAVLRTLSCASCTGFTPTAVQALAGMQGLIELNLRGVMHSAGLGTLQFLTALQALTRTLSFPATVMSL